MKESKKARKRRYIERLNIQKELLDEGVLNTHASLMVKTGSSKELAIADAKARIEVRLEEAAVGL